MFKTRDCLFRRLEKQKAVIYYLDFEGGHRSLSKKHANRHITEAGTVTRSLIKPHSIKNHVRPFRISSVEFILGAARRLSLLPHDIIFPQSRAEMAGVGWQTAAAAAAATALLRRVGGQTLAGAASEVL